MIEAHGYDRVSRLAQLELATFVDILRWRALHQPERQAYIFLSDGEQEQEVFTYQQLDVQARLIAATLQKHIAIGDRALLLYPPGLDYIAAFLGCLYAGVIAVPVYPPASQRSIPRIQMVVADAGARLALTVGGVVTKMRAWSRLVPELAALDWIVTDEEGVLLSAEQWQVYTPEPKGLTFLQYTSGSTGIPKGVMVSHGNLMHNSEMMRVRAQHTPESIGISWLPMFHDMGLILGVLQPLYVGFPTFLLAPTAFIQRPLRWLQAISHYQCTTSYAPNFAYELCVNRITPEERAHMHLESWRMAVNAAEPVRPETVERFIANFASCGLKSTTMTPAYGLAETTLMVSACTVDAELTIIHVNRSQLERHRVHSAENAEPGQTQALVSCGQAAKDQRVVIVNPETMRESSPQEIGEIWVAGPSMAQGYWQRPLETEQTFHAFLKETGDGPFVRTGDLGFIANGELFITGRLKDLIILRGRNYYPQDIELTVEQSHVSLRPDFGAAFSVAIANEERLVVVQEVVRHHEDLVVIIKAIRQAIAAHYEIKAHAIVLIRYGSILKTSSGKIQRRACREAFLKNELLVVASDVLEESVYIEERVDLEKQRAFLQQLTEAPEPRRRAMLLALVTEQVGAVFNALSEPQITPEQNLLSLGMDSLTGTQLVNRLENFLGCALPDILPFMMSEPTVERLVDYLATVLFSKEPLDE